MSELPIQARVAAAKALLESSSAEDYHELPAVHRAHFEEAIEFLHRIQNGSPGESRHGTQRSETTDRSDAATGFHENRWRSGDGGDAHE